MRSKTLVNAGNQERLLDALRAQAIVGVDTEFMRERTYFAQLCLVQIATRDSIFFVDPLEKADLDRVWDSLLESNWVLHSGRQDIEVVYQLTGRMPKALFDTQVAAALLGHAPQMGYAGLVKELFGTELEKSHTRADWTRRPLPQAMLDYAAEDVEYLLQARDRLAAQLEEKGRLAWAEEDSSALLDTELYRSDPDSAEARLKGARNLRGQPRRAAVALARWREQRALDADRPRQWILKDPVLLDIAQSNPRNQKALARIDGMPAAVVRRSGRDLLEVLATAASESDDYRPPQRPGETEKALLKAMQKTVGRIAADLDIAAEVIAPRKELAALMMGERDCRVLGGWRREIVGEELVKLLDE